jgi:hypothetical protein
MNKRNGHDNSATAANHMPPSIQSVRSSQALYYAYCALVTIQRFSNLTGRFIQPSCSGNTDMFLLYNYDSYYIHIKPMKGKSGPRILATYQYTHTLLTSHGLRPLL